MRLQGGGMKSVTTARRCARVIIACGLVLAAAGCGDSIPVGLAGRATGVLQVTVSTSGADLPANGYTVSVDSGAGQPVSVNGKVSLAGLTAGSHSVSLYGAPPNCAPNGANTRAFDVLAGDTVLVAFNVACTVIGPIVFASNRDGYPFQIYAMNADGSNPIRLTNAGLDPSWSPDGRGKEWVGEGGGPAWSPDGRKIAFSGKEGGISVMSVDLWSDVHVIAPGMWAKVAWSPDGAKIVFDHAECAECQDIGVMNEDGSGLVWLTPGPGRDFSPTWRPR